MSTGATGYTVVPATDLASDHVRRWSHIQLADPRLASPFFRPEFTQIVASARRDVYVTVMDVDGTPQGFFPHQRDALGRGRPVGGRISDYHGAICTSGLRWDARRLIRASGLRVWDFDHLPTYQTEILPFRTRGSDSPYLDLSAGYEAYRVTRRTSMVISQTERRRRKLEREVGPLSFFAHRPDAMAFATLEAWKTAQYRRSHQRNPFRRRWVKEVLMRVLGTVSPYFAGMLSTLYAGDRLVAVHLGMRSARAWHYWFPAYDPEYARYSPGLILLLAMAMSAEAQSIRVIDLGRGEEPYKRRLASDAFLLAEGSVVDSKAVAVSKAMTRRPLEIARRGPLRHLRVLRR